MILSNFVKFSTTRNVCQPLCDR